MCLNAERIDVDPSVFTVSSAVNEFNYEIRSFSDAAREIMLDLTSAVLVFDQSTTFVLINSIILFVLTLKLLSTRETPLCGYFGSFFSQDYSKLFDNSIKCLFTLLWLVFTFFTMHFITGNFKTDLVQKYPVKRIETLSDVAESQTIPKFAQVNPIFDLFESGYTKDYERVWSKCKARKHSCIIRNNMEEYEVTLKKAFKQEAVFISNMGAHKYANAMICRQQYDRKISKFNERYTISKPFLGKVVGYSMNSKVQRKLKNVVNKV